MKIMLKQCAGLFSVFALLFLFASAPVIASTAHSAKSEETASETMDATLSLEGGQAEHGGHAAANPLSQMKLKDFGWRIVNFIALLIILVKLGAKPLGLSLSGRREQIVTEIEELEQRKAEAEKSYQEFQDKLGTVEADIDKIVDRAVAQAEVEKEKILEKAEAAAEEMKRSAEQAVQNEVAEARSMLREEVAEKAAVMAEKIIKDNLKANDQKVIIENYLAKVGAIS